MSSIIQPWLWPSIEKEVRQVLQWQLEAPANPQAESKVKFEDDGSNLRIPSLERGNCVQILNFTNFEDPIQAVISDKITSIRATIEATIAEDFIRKERKRITKDTIGGIFQIQKFEIVATHLGPSHQRLTLLIQELKHIRGIDGSGVFGNPSPIEHKAGIQNFLDELKTYRSRQPIQANRCSSEERHSTECFDEDRDTTNDIGTQEGFATQIPPPNRIQKEPMRPLETLLNEAAIKEKPPVPKEFEILSQAGSRSSSIVESPQKLIKAQKSRIPTNLNLTCEIGPSILKTRKRVNDGAGLLSLLGKKAGVKRALSPSAVHHSTKRERTSNAEDNEDIKVVPNKGLSKASATPSVIEQMSKRIAIPNITTDRVANIAAAKTVQPSDHKQGTSYIASDDCVIIEASDGDFKSTQLLPNDLSKTRAYSFTRDNSRAVQITQGLAPLATNVVKHDPLLCEEDPWKGYSRISRRDVRISKDQQMLLDRTESWLPLEPGSRGPVANVPIRILQSCSTIAEQRATLNTVAVASSKSSLDTPDRGLPRLSQSKEDFGDQIPEEADSDLPVSSQAWPTSPPVARRPNQLPPDSSVEKVRKYNIISPTLSSGQRSQDGQSLQKLSPRGSPYTPHGQTSHQDIAEISWSLSSRTSAARKRPSEPSSALRPGSSAESELRTPRRQERLKYPAYAREKSYGSSCKLDDQMTQHHPSTILASQSKVASDNVDRTRKAYACDVCGHRYKNPGGLKYHKEHTPCFNGRNTQMNSDFGRVNSSGIKGTDSSAFSSKYEKKLLMGIPRHENSSSGRHSALRSSTDVQQSQFRSQDGTAVDFVINLESSNQSSASDSELETAVPNALGTMSTIADENGSPVGRIPFTANQARIPILQVKRTPYRTGLAENDDISAPSANDCSSLIVPADQPRSLLPILNDMTEHLLSSRSVVQATLPIENDLVNGPELIEHNNIRVAICNNRTDSSANVADVGLKSELISPTNGSSIGPIDLSSDIDSTESRRNGSASVVSSSRENVSFASDNNDIATVKRKFTENDLSSNITKRRKRVKLPGNFHFSQEPRVIDDPSLKSCQYRREFFASRKATKTTPHERSEDLIGSSVEYASTATIQDAHREVEFDKEPADSDINSENAIWNSKTNAPSQLQVSASTQTPTSLAGESDLLHEELRSVSTLAAHLNQSGLPSCPLPEIQKTVPAPSTQINIFDYFRNTYPQYRGDMQHFIAMGRKIDFLVANDRVEHQSLWDDFIIRHCTKYRQYLVDCAEKANDPMAYEPFYRNKVDVPKYTARIITPRTLKDVLELEHQIPQVGAQNKDEARAVIELSRDDPTVNEPALDHSIHTKPFPFKIPGKDVVDLTNDIHEFQASDTPSEHPLPLSAKKISRIIPWTKPKSTIKSPLGSTEQIFLHQASTFTRDATSTPKRSPTKIDINKSSSHGLQSSSWQHQLLAAASPAKTTTADMKIINNTPRHPKSPVSGPDTSRSTHSSVIDWLEKASSNTSLSPASEAFRSGGKEDHKLGWRNKEEVKGNEKVNIQGKEQQRDESEQRTREKKVLSWWQDPDTPFKSFVRAYASITPGNGNGFAKGKAKEEIGAGRIAIDDHGTVLVERKAFDVLNWTL